MDRGSYLSAVYRSKRMRGTKRRTGRALARKEEIESEFDELQAHLRGGRLNCVANSGSRSNWPDEAAPACGSSVPISFRLNPRGLEAIQEIHDRRFGIV
jgi:hypothetical protein